MRTAATVTLLGCIMLAPLSALALQNGAGGTFEYNGTDSYGRARAACESRYGAGACSAATCGWFSYWYPTAAGTSCTCGFPPGYYEWIYSNLGYEGVGEDFGQGVTPSVTGATEFVRLRNSNTCYGDAWSLMQIGYPASAAPLQNGAGGTFTYVGTKSLSRAKAACEAKYGAGACTGGTCGNFLYWYRASAGPSCTCGFPAGEYEFVYANNGYTGVGEDFGQGSTPSVAGLSEFVRRKETNYCYGGAWSLAQRGYPSAFLQRENRNVDPTNLAYVVNRPTGVVRGKEMFLNNLTEIGSVSVRLANWPAGTMTDFVTVKIAHACGGGSGWQYLGGGYVSLPAGQTSTWATVSMVLPVNVTYGDYYILEITTDSSQLATNRNAFPWGRWVLPTDAGIWQHHNLDLVAFENSLGVPGQKKQDMMFLLRGRADLTTPSRPTPTTNVACPGWCVLVGDHENAPGGDPSRALNVLVRETRGNPDNSFQPGSFLYDDMNTLRSALVSNMIEGPGSYSPLISTYPLSAWYPDRMNFYVSRESPNSDPDYLRGFMYCANIDAIVDVNPATGMANYSTSGSFQGVIMDPRMWNMSRQMMHEAFGHGVGGLGDEYVCATDYTCTFQNASPLYRPDTAPLGSGSTACADLSSAAWCAGSLTVDELIDEMQWAGDPDVDCWDLNATQCAANADVCHYVGGASIAYFGSHVCVPKNVVKYDIGVGCAPNSGCYIGAAAGQYHVILDVAQASVPVMNTQHHPDGQPPSYLGFGGALEPFYQKLLECVFDTTGCASYDYAGCAALEDKWNGGPPNANNLSFLLDANACSGGVNRRR